MNAHSGNPDVAATTARTADPLYGGSADRRVTVRDLAAAKARGEKWPMLTAYDALTARVFDEAGIPVLLVGDSAGMVVFGHDSTIPVTVDEMLALTAAVGVAPACQGGAAAQQIYRYGTKPYRKTFPRPPLPAEVGKRPAARPRPGRPGAVPRACRMR